MKTRLIRNSAEPRLSVTCGRENLTFFPLELRVSGRNLYPYTDHVEGRAIGFAFKDYTGTMEQLRDVAANATKWSEVLEFLSGGPDNVPVYIAKAKAK